MGRLLRSVPTPAGSPFPTPRSRDALALTASGRERPTNALSPVRGKRRGTAQVSPLGSIYPDRASEWAAGAGLAADGPAPIPTPFSRFVGAKVERERLGMSLGLVGWLALGLYARLNSLHEEVDGGSWRLPDVDSCSLSINRFTRSRRSAPRADRRSVAGVRASAPTPGWQNDRFDEHARILGAPEPEARRGRHRDLAPG